MDPVILAMLGAGIMGGSTIAGSILGGSKTTERQPWPQFLNTAHETGQLIQRLISAEQKGNAPKYAGSFDITQPEVLNAAESTILGKLRNPGTNVKDYTEATKKYSEATKASMADTFADEMQKTKDMYNRLGLVSSTPGLEAQQEVASDQATAQNLFDAELMYKNLDRQLQAQGLDISELNSILNQAQILGSTQIANQKYTQGAGYDEFVRQAEYPTILANLGTNFIKGGQTSYQTTPNTWSQIGSLGQDIGTKLLMSGMLGGGGSVLGGGSVSGGGSSGLGLTSGLGTSSGVSNEELMAILNSLKR
jgi:hypothetical protein